MCERLSAFLPKTSGLGFRLLPHTLLLFLLTIIPSLNSGTAAGAESRSPVQPVSLSVYYEKSTDRISVNASRAPLEKVFELIAKHAPITVEAADEQLLQTEVSVEIPLQPLEEALRGLLNDFNTTFFYYEANDPITKTQRPVLAKVKIISKNAQGVLASRPANSGLTIWGAPDQKTNADLKANDDIAAKYDLAGLFQALKQPGTDKEKQRIIELLIGLLPEIATEKDHQAFADILTSLKEFAPDQAVVPLVNLLRDTEKNRVYRAMAASALGEVGNDYAVEPLITAFHDSDALVQPNAAMGLARLSNARGLETLLNVFNGNDQLLQQSVATTLAMSGSPQARQALNKLIAAGKLATETIPPDTTDVPTGK